MKIYKYHVALRDIQVLRLPEGANIIKAGVQNNKIYIWAEVEPDNIDTYRKIHVIPTGHMFDKENLEYIDTVFMKHFVWHIYEGEGL